MSEPEVRLEPLLETADAEALPLPAELERAYGGPLRLPAGIVYGNFVASIDGVAAIEGIRMSSATISGGHPADRLVMALLRTAADAIVVGSGTLREHEGPWTGERAYPPAAPWIPAAREAIGAAGRAPTLVVTTASGELPSDHPALPEAVVATTSRGAQAIARRAIACAAVLDLGDADEVEPREVIARLRERGSRRILTEGGPRLMGSMLEASAVDELFLTISPKLLGGGEGRPPLTDSTDLLQAGRDGTLVDVRRSADHLFLRYRLAVGGHADG